MGTSYHTIVHTIKTRTLARLLEISAASRCPWRSVILVGWLKANPMTAKARRIRDGGMPDPKRNKLCHPLQGSGSITEQAGGMWELEWGKHAVFWAGHGHCHVNPLSYTVTSTRLGGGGAARPPSGNIGSPGLPGKGCRFLQCSHWEVACAPGNSLPPTSRQEILIKLCCRSPTKRSHKNKTGDLWKRRRTGGENNRNLLCNVKLSNDLKKNQETMISTSIQLKHRNFHCFHQHEGLAPFCSQALLRLPKLL